MNKDVKLGPRMVWSWAVVDVTDEVLAGPFNGGVAYGRAVEAKKELESLMGDEVGEMVLELKCLGQVPWRDRN